MEHKLNTNSIEAYRNAESLCRCDCANYINGILQERENKRLELWLDESGWYPTCAYDGGNHPEYASNCFSEIQSVYIDKNGELSLDLEDTKWYPISGVSTEDIVRLAEYIDEYFDELLKANEVTA